MSGGPGEGGGEKVPEGAATCLSSEQEVQGAKQVTLVHCAGGRGRL